MVAQRSEREDTEILANRILDRVNADPDDDISMLSRQFLRALEREVILRASNADLRVRFTELWKVIEEWHEFYADCAQLLDGWHQDGTTWTEHDTKIRCWLIDLGNRSREALRTFGESA